MKSSEILSFLDQEGIEYEAVRVSDDEVEGYSSLFNYREGTMTFIVPERQFADYADKFGSTTIPFMIIGQTEEDSPVFSSVIRVKSPRRVFFALLDGLFEKAPGPDITGISDDPEVYTKNSYIAPSAKIGKNVRIGVGCVIEGNVVIGDNTEIHHNVVIRNKTRIGANCTIHSGTVIGEYGFGYVKNEQNEKTMLRHYGGVVIEDDVHIGDNCVIIRGAIDDTIIHKGVKMNTMVHIAHNDEIGANTLITSPCHVCGSVTIGENCHIAGATIRNQRTVGANVTVGLGAVVVKDVEDGLTVVGNPAKPMIK
jgi:UDP-3-O-[3-hydroxymyristoyl] glucosamine N-acyltransferase